jgi:hypothetical protein
VAGFAFPMASLRCRTAREEEVRDELFSALLQLSWWLTFPWLSLLTFPLSFSTTVSIFYFIFLPRLDSVEQCSYQFMVMGKGGPHACRFDLGAIPFHLLFSRLDQHWDRPFKNMSFSSL